MSKQNTFKVIVTETVTTVYESNNTVAIDDCCDGSLESNKGVLFDMSNREGGFSETSYKLVRRTITLVEAE